MNLPTAIALTAILAALIVATGASMRSESDAGRLGSLCPYDTPCEHAIEPTSSLHDALQDWEQVVGVWLGAQATASGS